MLNTITSTTISAVSRKRHTTRHGILATRTINNTQLVFIDTPGFVHYNSPKDETIFRELVKNATTSMDRADYTLVMIDAARKITQELKEELAVLMLAAHHSRGRVDDVKVNEMGEVEEVVMDKDALVQRDKRDKFAIVLNKVDLVNPKDKLLDIAEELGLLGDACVRFRGEVQQEGRPTKGQLLDVMSVKSDPTNLSGEDEIGLIEQYPPIFFISALKNDGVDDLVEYLLSHATTTKNFVLPPEQKTTMTLTERIEELIREKVYRCLHREVPHSITQVNRVLKEGRTRDGKNALRIDQDLIVKTKSHYNLVMGRGGMTLRRIEDTARRDLLNVLSTEGFDDIFLTLHVKLSKSKQHTRNLEAESEGVSRKIF